jgi:hypothetical protein
MKRVEIQETVGKGYLPAIESKTKLLLPENQGEVEDIKRILRVVDDYDPIGYWGKRYDRRGTKKKGVSWK